jgi:soluble lytic murein transglycosylase-like protein
MGRTRAAQLAACAAACLALSTATACAERDASGTQFPDYPPPPLDQAVAAEISPLPSPSASPAPVADRAAIKTMLYKAALKHGVNPALVMGLAWWESGWNESAVSSAGAVGIMQVMPATAAADGPALLHRTVDLHDAADNIDMGTAIIRNNLDRYHGDLVSTLVAYYAGGAAVRPWRYLTPDEQRYVWGIYRLAVAFQNGTGPA